MSTANKKESQSPWPACADCQISAAELETRAGEGQCPVQLLAAEPAGTKFEDLEPSAELGLRRDEVRRQVEAAFARALARAQSGEQRKSNQNRE